MRASHSKPQEPAREEGTFLRKMFAYAYVAVEALPPHRQDKDFLELAGLVVANYPNPGQLTRFIDHARARLQQRGELVRLEDYR